MIVLINAEGKYLSYSEHSGHTANNVNTYNWGELDHATLCPNLIVFNKLKWSGAPPETVGFLFAREERKVFIVPNPG